MNRKNVLIVKLVLLIVLFIIALPIAVNVLVKGNFNSMNFSFGSEILSSQSYSDLENIDTSVYSYSVHVEEHSGSDVLVEIHKQGFGTAPTPTISQSSSHLNIAQQPSFGFNIGGGKIVIKVPNGSAYDYNLKSTSGSIHIDAQSKNVVAKSTSGSVKVYQDGSSIDASSTSGSVKIYAPFDTIKAHSLSGSVKAVASANAKVAKLNSTSGSIKLSLSNNIGYVMTYSSVSGSIKDEYNGLEFNKNGTTEYGNKQLKIDVSTVSGSIKLCEWS